MGSNLIFFTKKHLIYLRSKKLNYVKKITQVNETFFTILDLDYQSKINLILEDFI